MAGLSVCEVCGVGWQTPGSACPSPLHPPTPVVLAFAKSAWDAGGMYREGEERRTREGIRRKKRGKQVRSMSRDKIRAEANTRRRVKV